MQTIELEAPTDIEQNLNDVTAPIAADKQDLPVYKKQVNNWHSARIVFKLFLEAHPELGLKYTETTYKNFCRIHAPKLIDLGIIRKSGLRQPAIADIERFDAPAFELLSKAGYTKEMKELLAMKPQ